MSSINEESDEFKEFWKFSEEHHTGSFWITWNGEWIYPADVIEIISVYEAFKNAKHTRSPK